MHIHIIQHEAFETPGAIADWIETNRIKKSSTKLYSGETLPSVIDFDMLIIMGGPQSPYTTMEECAHFDSLAEQAFIRQVIVNNKLVLGICLGAQMISNSLGGLTTKSPEKEIGLFPVSLTDAGRNDELLADFPDSFNCGHWHGDMAGLTDESIVLAQSEGCPRQIIRFTPKVYAIQCHLEFTPSAINDMITNCAVELENEQNRRFVQSAEQLRNNDYSSTNALLFRFLDRFITKIQ